MQKGLNLLYGINVFGIIVHTQQSSRLQFYSYWQFLVVSEVKMRIFM